MTRINCVPVGCLNDKHLLAEYKEITRPFNKVIKRIENGTMDEVNIPDKYCLGQGHETFFFNKLFWLIKRYEDLYEELEERGFNISSTKFWDIVDDFHDKLVETEYYCDWTPTPEDMYLNMSRIVQRCQYDSVKEELSDV